MVFGVTSEVVSHHLGPPDIDARSRSVLLLSKLNKIYFGYFDPEFFFLIIKIIIFRGELTDISAKKEALVFSRLCSVRRTGPFSHSV